MGMKLQGSENLRRTFRDMSKVVDVFGPEVVKTMANQVYEGAKTRAPRDTGLLEDGAIQVVHEGTNVRPVSTIFVDEDIAPYAIYVHEGMPLGTKYNLGKGSRAKNGGTPHTGTGVGWKFLERSFNAVYRKYLRFANDKIDHALGRLVFLSLAAAPKRKGK